MGQTTKNWWRNGAIYQIYPRSFMDGNGDGVGDLPGITGKLEYLSNLGVDAVWLSPIFPSPMADFGYDVADYTDIHPMFGTLDDFDALVAKARSLGLKVLLDYVPNHTSDEHEWFVESRASRGDPKREWYIWRDAKDDGSPPNNWESYFGGPAWEWDEATGQYYLHLFDKKQPDLNWRNPEVREAMYDAMRFWFDRGVDGLRIDVLWLLVKDEEFRDNPVNEEWKDGDFLPSRQSRVYSEDRPETMEIVREMRSVAEEYEESRVLVGEIYLTLERLMAYYGGETLDGVQLPFNFGLVLLENWDAKSVRSLVDEYEAALPGDGAWPNWVLGNHDMPRIASRVGEEKERLAAMLLLTLRGTPTMYYGDEIGMKNVEVPPHLAHDPQGKVHKSYGRDPFRTPMQWNAEKNAGFSNAEPWLPVAGDHQKVNVEARESDPSSTLSLYKKLLGFRRVSTALGLGAYSSLDGMPDECFAYLREHKGEKLLVVLNFSGEEVSAPLPEGGWRVEVSTRLDREEKASGVVEMRPYEGVVMSEG
ncbi:MAG: alpha-glucosidase C-terminal domain-containing protein [Rubrobacter sp.]|nr:alpha-glucosidase C-terminal domain-containing protein [Rubrobacter sp.]